VSYFDNVKVPKENRLGEERMGFKIMMEELRERLTVGFCSSNEGAIEDTIAHDRKRGFKTQIADFKTPSSN
jgi:acyl-CoA dehydrogenase